MDNVCNRCLFSIPSKVEMAEEQEYLLKTTLFFEHFLGHICFHTGKNNGSPFLNILGYLKNTHKNPKFGRVRQIPNRELGWEFPDWDLSHFGKFGIFVGIL